MSSIVTVGAGGEVETKTIKDTITNSSWQWGNNADHILKFTEDGKVYGNNELAGSWRASENTLMFEYSGGYIWSFVEIKDKNIRFLGYGGGHWHEVTMYQL